MRKRLASFGYAFAGLATLLRTQPNARIHAIATVVVAVAGLFFELNIVEWAAVVAAITVVWIAEALNTAIEFLADAAVPDPHSLVKHAKDVAAAAVLLAALGALIIGVLIFWPKIVLFLLR